ncbi:Spy/CpxP family protein refolding chaperone [Halomonas sp. BLK-85]
MVKHHKMMAVALVTSLTAVTATALAQGMNQGAQGQGGMMNGQGGMSSGMMMHGMGNQRQGSLMNGQGSMGSGMMMGGMMNGMSPGMMIDGMGSMAGMTNMLDEAQMSSMREMRQEHRATQLERMGEMMNMRDDMMQIMQAERPDPEEVKALHGQMASLHGEMMADNVRMRNQVQDLLTDEQRARMRGNMSGHGGLNDQGQ